MPTTAQAKKAWEHGNKGKKYYDAMTEEQKKAMWQYGHDRGLIDTSKLGPGALAEYRKYVDPSRPEYIPRPSIVEKNPKTYYKTRSENLREAIMPNAAKSLLSKTPDEIAAMPTIKSTPKTLPKLTPSLKKVYAEELAANKEPTKQLTVGKGKKVEVKPQGKVASKDLKRPDNPFAPLLVNALNTSSLGLLERNTDAIDQLREKAPIRSTIGSMAGYLAPFSAAKGAVVKGAQTVGKRILTDASIGAGIDTATELVKGKNDFETAAKNVAMGAGAGILADVGLTALGKIGQSIAKKLANAEKLTKTEMDTINKLPAETKQKIVTVLKNEVKETPQNLSGRLSDVDMDIIAEKAATWKDKPQKLAYKRETMERNFMDIIPDKDEAKKMIDIYIEPIRKSEADSIRSINKMRNEVKQFGIKAFSKESELVQKYGEGLITKEELAKETSNPEKIIKAAEYLRNKYDELLDKANEVLKANGYKPIPKRPNYMPHQGEIETIMQKIGIETPDLPTDINGLTDMFVPGKSFFSHALRRKGDKTAYDAIRGFDNYIEGINKIIYQTPNIKRIRQLETALRNKYKDTTHLSNFVSELREWGNLIAGKKSKLDRGAEEFVGRQVYKIADTIRKQLGANMVGANVSSALTNFIPLTQTLAEVDKISFIEAMGQTIANIFKNDGFIDQSDFLVRRFGSDRLALTNWQKAGRAANWLFQVIDGFTSQVITRAKYLENIKQGLDHATAMKEANAYAGKVMADRSIGQIPTLFGSKTIAPLSQFQIEVNNQISHIFKDLPREYAKNKVALASMYAQIALYSYLFNNLFEKATGRRPAFDVIGVAQKAYQDYNNDNLTTGEANKNTIKNIADQLPFTSVLTGGRIPIGNAFPDLIKVASGEADIKKELKKPLINLLLPTGGAQLNKTIQGLSTYNKGGAYNDTGTQLKFPIEKNKANLLRSALFGQYSTPEAREYYDNARTPLSEKQTELYQKQVKVGKDEKEAYDDIMRERKVNSLKLKISKIRNDENIKPEDKLKQIKVLQDQIKELNKR